VSVAAKRGRRRSRPTVRGKSRGAWGGKERGVAEEMSTLGQTGWDTSLREGGEKSEKGKKCRSATHREKARRGGKCHGRGSVILRKKEGTRPPAREGKNTPPPMGGGFSKRGRTSPQGKGENLGGRAWGGKKGWAPTKGAQILEGAHSTRGSP